MRASKKPKLSYREFLAFKEEYLRDTDPLVDFAVALYNEFGITELRLPRGSSVAVVRVALDNIVEWVE